jgi:DNA-binding response OmpR family regulator
MKHRVLVIDDDESVRASIGRVLKSAGYEVTTAADSAEAIIKFVPGKIDLVLLDLNLRSGSGWDVLERLTAQNPAVPIIIITGMPNQYQTAVAAGVGALIEKPVEVPVLLKTINEVLGEPEEARLRRVCGYQLDTRHLRRPDSDKTNKSRPLASRAPRRATSNRVPRLK